MLLHHLEHSLPTGVRPSALLRLFADKMPALARGILGLSAQGYLPGNIYYNRFSQTLAPELFPSEVRLHRGPYRLYVPLHLLPEYRNFEPMTVERFRQSLTKGMTVVDVGANVGYYTLTAARAVGRRGVVHAIEPCDTNLAVLYRNVELSDLRNIHIHTCAAGANHGERRFYVTQSSFDHGFYQHPLAEIECATTVEQVPIDDLISTRVDVVKIDVEGAEIDVINGMTRTVRENQGLSLFVEWAPLCMKQAGRQAHELPDRLRELGFRDLRVMDDLGRRECSVDDILQMLKDLPEKVWYGMIWARK